MLIFGEFPALVVTESVLSLTSTGPVWENIAPAGRAIQRINSSDIDCLPWSTALDVSFLEIDNVMIESV